CLALAPLILGTGCSQTQTGTRKAVAEPATRAEQANSGHADQRTARQTGETAPADKKVQPVALTTRAPAPTGADPARLEPLPASTLAIPRPPETASPPAPTWAEVAPCGMTLTLPDAIALAFQRQPRLRAHLESIEQARGL